MRDRVAGAPGQYSGVVTGGEFQKLQSGQPFNITLMRDDNPEVEGTPYSKAAVLPDDLAESLCPDIEDPTPADALKALNKGKAPAGYGLGGNATTVENADGIIASGYYETAISIGGYIESCIVWHNQHSPNYAEQNAVSVLGQCVGSILHRVKISGNWQPWEWVNPPMVPGVEYRTTERRNGVGVYKRLNNGIVEYRLADSSTWKNMSEFFDVARLVHITTENSGASFTSILRDNWGNIPYTLCGVLSIRRGGNAIGGLYSKATEGYGTVMLFSYAIGGHHLAVYNLSGTTWTENVL